MAKRKTVSGVFTLSVYGPMVYGIGHRTEGTVSDLDKLSFAESLNPLINMIEKFRGLPLGSKIRVRMDTVS